MQSENGDDTNLCACGAYDLTDRPRGELRVLTPDRKHPQIRGTQWVLHRYDSCLIPRHRVNTYEPAEVN